MTMNRIIYIIALLAASAVLASCGGNAVRNVTVHDNSASYRSVYLWEPDGHTDLSLLTALKDGAAERLRDGGYTISNDPDATAAYLKITLYDAEPVDGSDGLIKGRVFVIEAADRKVVYDVTAEVTGGVDKGYPVDKFLDEAMDPLLGKHEEK